MDFDEKEARAFREVTSRAIRRLDLLEYLILLVALVLSLAGGALVAWIFHSWLGFPFRLTWLVGSLLLFVVPGGFVYLREIRRTPTRRRGESNGVEGARNGVRSTQKEANG